MSLMRPRCRAATYPKSGAPNITSQPRVAARKVAIVIAEFVLLLHLHGCALPQREVLIHQSGDVSIASYPSELRGAYILRRGNTASLCAEPFPDTAAQSALELAAKFSDSARQAAAVSTSEDESASASSEASGSAEGSLKAATEVVALAGRTQAVLIARELLYRLCEARLNDTLTGKEAYVLFNETLKVVKSIAAADEKRAEAQASTANAVLLDAQKHRDDSATVLTCVTTREACLKVAQDIDARSKCTSAAEECVNKVQKP